MSRTIRSVALVAGAALALSACGLGGLIPDQEVPDGVLGLGGGVQVELVPGGAGPSIDVTPTATTWVGTIEASFDLDGLTGGNIPNVVSPDAITETIELGDSLVVRNPGFVTGPFTVTGLAIGGTITVGGQTLGVPANLAVTGLQVLFDGPTCVPDAGDEVCTYTTASSPPSLDLAFTPQQVAAYWSLLRADGGTVSVDLTVTVTLEAPGLPTAATVTVTIDSGGATIEF